MARTFFKNFRESTDRIATPNVFGVTDFSRKLNLPNTDADRNSYDWQKRVAVPFSYKVPNQKTRQYGIIYAPESEARKFYHNYNEYGEPQADYNDIAVYGAELTNGPSLTAKGFLDFFDKVKNDDFRLEKDMTHDVSSRSMQDTNNGTVPVASNPFFRNLREILSNFQKKGKK